MRLANAVGLATPGVVAAVLFASAPSSAASTPAAWPSRTCISKNSVDPQAVAAIHAAKDPVSVGRVNHHLVAMRLSEIRADAARGHVIMPDGGTWDWVCADSSWRGFGGSQD